MRYRISTLLAIVFVIGASIALIKPLFERPEWLVALHGQPEAQAISCRGESWRPKEFVPSPETLIRHRKRLRKTLPPNCTLVRELRWQDRSYLYTAFLEKRDGEWIVFDTEFHHEDRVFHD